MYTTVLKCIDEKCRKVSVKQESAVQITFKKKIPNTQIIALNHEMPIGAIIVRCNNISNEEQRYTIKHTPVHTDTHDNIHLILVNEILLF